MSGGLGRRREAVLGCLEPGKDKWGLSVERERKAGGGGGGRAEERRESEGEPERSCPASG